MTTTAEPALDTIAAAELKQMRADDPEVRILDVRTGGEFETSHIPGAYNVPLDTLGEHASELAQVDHPVVLVCKSGNRASQACTRLAAAGKSSMRVLDGGMDAWQAVDGDVAHGAVERWAMDRQVRLVAGTLVLTGILVSTVVPKAKWLAGAIGAGLTYSALSNTCTMGDMLAKLPYNRTEECDVAEVVDQLNRVQAA